MRRAPPRIPYPILYAIIRASRSSSSSLPFFISFRTTLAPRFIPFPSGTLSFDTLRHRLLQVYKALDFVSNKPWNQHSVFAGLRITSLIPPTPLLVAWSRLCSPLALDSLPFDFGTACAIVIPLVHHSARARLLGVAPTWTPLGALSPITRTTVRMGPTLPEPEVTPLEPEASTARNCPPSIFSLRPVLSFRHHNSHPGRRLLPARPDLFPFPLRLVSHN